jgi:hypothetical protein
MMVFCTNTGAHRMIVWGTKKVYRHLGYVADFCPICTGSRPFSLERVGMAGHLYYISAGEGRLAGYQLNCLDCNVLLNGEPEQYAAFATRPEPLPTLIKQTFPTLAEARHNRFAIEHQIRTDLASLSADTRRALLMEPFTLLSPKVVKRFAQTHFEMGSTYMRREILPVLARTLARLHPTEQELQAVLTRLAQMRDPMGTRVKLAELMAAIAACSAAAPAASATRFGTSEFSTPEPHSPIRMRRAGERAGGALLPYEKAGKVLKIVAWISAFCTLMLAGTEISHDKPITTELIAITAALIALTGLLAFANWAIMRHDKRGRVLGIGLGAVFLIWLPIGTIVGAYVLWCLIKGWGDEDAAPSFAT